MATNLHIEPRGDREIFLTAQFNAPKSLVFLAHSACKHLKHWVGPSYLETTECEMDFRPGGKWRMVHKAPDGSEHVFFGEILEVVDNEKIVRTFIYEPYADFPSHETLTLSESDGITTLEILAVHTNQQARDGMMASGMEAGVQDSWNRLSKYMEELSVNV